MCGADLCLIIHFFYLIHGSTTGIILTHFRGVNNEVCSGLLKFFAVICVGCWMVSCGSEPGDSGQEENTLELCTDGIDKEPKSLAWKSKKCFNVGDVQMSQLMI